MSRSERVWSDVNRLIPVVFVCLVLASAAAVNMMDQDTDTEDEKDVETDIPQMDTATKIVIPEGTNMDGCVVHMDRVHCPEE